MILDERGIQVEQLAKQVKNELLRTGLWFVIAMGAGIGIFLVVWK